jgi:hypothetical protein
MARKTKAEIEALRAAQEQLNRERDRNGYPSRLMAALERSHKFNYDLAVEDGLFSLYNRDDPFDILQFTVEYTDDSLYNLVTLEIDLTLKEKKLDAALQEQALKKAALAKLTKEERALLGL